MKRFSVVAVSLFLAASVLAPSAGATSIKQARWDIKKYERKTPGIFEIRKCGRAYGLVVCPVLRYDLEVEGLGGPNDWEFWDCVDKRRTVINPMFTVSTTDAQDENCLWAIDKLFPEEYED